MVRIKIKYRKKKESFKVSYVKSSKKNLIVQCIYLMTSIYILVLSICYILVYENNYFFIKKT